MTILVTGATAGPGRTLSQELAHRGQTVLLHGRSDPRLAESVGEIAEAAGNERPEATAPPRPLAPFQTAMDKCYATRTARWTRRARGVVPIVWR